MTQAFYRKWRPQKWEQVVGQEHVVQPLRNSVVADRIGHAYLFAGPRGTGKTTTARMLAKAVNCLDADLTRRPCDQCEHCQAVDQGRFLDLIEIDAASNTSVDDVRALRDKINFSPNQGRYKVYIIDEVHMLSTAAFNALLKTLEEPPSHAIFILATTEVHKIPATVLSRCQRHEFRRIPVNTIVEYLKTVVEGEGLQAEGEALVHIARQSTGSLRDAISLLDQMASTGGQITTAMVQTVLGTAASQAVVEIVDALQARDAKTGLERIHAALDAGSDPRQFARQIVEYLRGLLLIRMGNASQVEATAEIRAQMARHAQAFQTLELMRVLRVFNTAAAEARLSWQPALPLEMAYLEGLEDEPQAQASEGIPAGEKPTAARKEKSTGSAPAGQTAQVQTGSSPAEQPASSLQPEETGGPANRVTLEMVNKNWNKIVSSIKQRSPNTAALVNSGKILGVKDGVLYFGFSEVLKTKMEKSENLEVVTQVLRQVFGFDVAVRIVTSTGRQGTPPPDVDGDGMVATALRDLGGEIVDVQ
jgi:DNA polymerase-3 subunit gamma/tau